MDSPLTSSRASRPDRLFADPRLAAVYDAVDGERADLDLYVGLVDELGAGSVLDVGCGTGTFACRLAHQGIEVTGLDPAAASLAVARSKPSAEAVHWIVAGAADAPPLGVDLVTMTGNVAQVFLADAEWSATLAACHRALHPGGHLVFETRDPACRAWERWTPEHTRRRVPIAGDDDVEIWTEVTSVDLPFVSFRHTYRFGADPSTLTSNSTLRFRPMDELRRSLEAAGFEVVDVRDAPDRPGLEWVVIARRR